MTVEFIFGRLLSLDPRFTKHILSTKHPSIIYVSKYMYIVQHQFLYLISTENYQSH